MNHVGWTPVCECGEIGHSVDGYLWVIQFEWLEAGRKKILAIIMFELAILTKKMKSKKYL